MVTAMGSKDTSSQKDTKSSNDEDLLAHLGYKQEFKRDFSRIELFGLSFSIVGVVQSIAYVFTLSLVHRFDIHDTNSAVLLYSIPYGGPAAMVWGVSHYYIALGISAHVLCSGLPVAASSSLSDLQWLSWALLHQLLVAYITGHSNMPRQSTEKSCPG
jgi:uncharacterized membrane protein YesL